MKIVQLLGILLIASVTGFAQKQQVAKANQKFDKLAYIDAIEIYERVANKGYESQDVFKKLGDAYYFNAELDKAAKWYGKLFELEGAAVEPEYYFRYSHTLKSLGEYKKANEKLEEFYKLNGSDSRAKIFEANKNYLELIEENSGRYKVDNLSIVNSVFSDFGAMVFNDALLFSSSRAREGSMKSVDNYTKQSFNTIYEAPISKEKNVEEPSLFSKSINDKFHVSSPVFTTDGQTMYFTKSVANSKNSKIKEDLVLLKLCKATLIDGKWRDVVELPFNVEGYSMAHPALSKDDKYLYFASNIEGTIGSSDLYKVEIKGDSYGELVNLGPGINTEGRETFPFVADDNVLYFASDGQLGLGGLDIFASKLETDDSYKTVANVGAPVNSQWDDFGFYINASTHEGFFTSNRDGGKGFDDIYKFYENKSIKDIIDCKQILAGNVSDNQSNERVTNIKVTLLDENLQVIEQKMADSQGNYSFDVACNKQYTVRVSGSEEYMANEQMIVTTSKSGATTPASIKVVRNKIKVDKDDDILNKAFGIYTIYFDLNKWNINKEAASQLALLVEVLNDKPTMKINIFSHTDSRGSAELNQRLSENRAKATLEWLVKKGIKRNRLTAVGVGESQLVNNCTDDVPCSEEEHKANRRSQFVVEQL